MIVSGQALPKNMSITPYTYAILSGVFTACLAVIYRVHLRSTHNPASLALVNSFGGAVVLALLIPLPSIDRVGALELLVLLVGNTLWALMVLWDIKAYQSLDLGINAILDSLRIVVLFLAGWLFFGEALSIDRACGLALVVVAILSGIGFSRIRNNPGARYRIGSVMAGSAALLCDKFLTTRIDLNLVLLAGYILPGIIYCVAWPRAMLAVPTEFKQSKLVYVLSPILFSLIGLSLIYGIGRGELGTTLIANQAKLVFILLLSWIALGERELGARKILTAIICLWGIYLAGG